MYLINQSIAALALLVLVAGCASTDPVRVHRQALVLDAHADIEIPGQESSYVGADGRSKVAPEKMRAGGVDAVVMSIAVGPGPRTAEGDTEARAIAEAELAAALALAADPENNVIVVRSGEELERAHNNHQGALILGLQNARIFGTDLDAINTFFDAGVRVFALTHMGHNNFADSSRPLYIAAQKSHEPEAEHGGLSPLGREAILRINDLGGIVDISQLSRDAALQVLKLSRAPVIASHSNVRALCDVSRNLSDEEIDLIGQRGGVIHVAPFRGYLYDSTDPNLDVRIRAARRDAGIEEDYYYPFELYWEINDAEVRQQFLNGVSELLGPGSLDDMLNHIDYLVARIGIDHVGIGTDFNHGSGIAGFNDASEAPNVTAALLARGYSPADINKIWGGNFVRVFREAQRLAQ